jgi:hypothetical protein
LLLHLFHTWLILRPWRRRRHVPPKRELTFNGILRYLPEARTLHKHRCENLKSYIGVRLSSRELQYQELLWNFIPFKTCFVETSRSYDKRTFRDALLAYALSLFQGTDAARDPLSVCS